MCDAIHGKVQYILCIENHRCFMKQVMNTTFLACHPITVRVLNFVGKIFA